MFRLIPGTTSNIDKNEQIGEVIEFYNIIEDYMSDVVCIVDRRGTVSYVSPSIMEVAGYSSEEYQGGIAFDIIHPDDREKLSYLHEKAFLSRKSFLAEYRVRHRNGSWIVLESKVVPINHNLETPKFVVVVARDVTDKRKSEELQGKIAKLEVAGQLARGFAHHVRNPLTSIKGFLSLLQPQIDNKEIVDILFNEIIQIENTINEYLALANQNPNQEQYFALSSVIQDAIEILHEKAKLANVFFTIHHEIQNISISGDEAQLKIALVNVLKNAIDSMEGGGMISIRVNTIDTDAVIQIIDQGCGIDPEIIPKLGEPLYILREKGTGIGLMQSFRIIYDHKGKIEFESEKEKGTKVTITLPLLT